MLSMCLWDTIRVHKYARLQFLESISETSPALRRNGCCICYIAAADALLFCQRADGNEIFLVFFSLFEI